MLYAWGSRPSKEAQDVLLIIISYTKPKIILKYID
jgi:hypothetical protein